MNLEEPFTVQTLKAGIHLNNSYSVAIDYVEQDPFLITGWSFYSK